MDRKICFKIGSPTRAEMPKWGDYYLVRSLGEAITKYGYSYLIQPIEEWYSRKEQYNIVIHVRGLTKYYTDPRHFNILWVISHVDLIEEDEFQNYDLILVASRSYLIRLSSMLEKPVQEFLQFTDTGLFYRDYSSEFNHDVVFVGNSRNIYRPIIRDAIAAGLNPAVYGNDWENLVPASYIKGKWIPNDILRQVYSSGKIVLNDHWPDMEENGIINNRFFDAAACEAIVINDDHPELIERFPDAIVYSGSAQLKELTHKILSNYDEYKRSAQKLSQEVKKYHNADARAKQLVEYIAFFQPTHSRPKKTLKQQVNAIILRFFGYGKLYRRIQKIYRLYKQIKRESTAIIHQRRPNPSRTVKDKINILRNKRNIHISFLVTETSRFTTAGDLFSAQGLGGELSKLKNYKVSYRSQMPENQWYVIPDDVDIAVAMLPDYDARICNRDNLIKLAWIRGLADDWLANPSLKCFDGIITSSQYILESIISRRNDLKEKCLGVVPLAVSDKEKAAADFERDIDVCFVGNLFAYPREIVKSLEIKEGMNFHFYGRLEAGKNHPWAAFHKGTLVHDRIHEIYNRSKIVLEDSLESTKGTVNLRTFEAAACGALVIANENAGYAELFGDRILTYQSKDQLNELIDYYLHHPKERAEMAGELQQFVLAHHTFKHRAEMFDQILREL